MTGDFMLSKLLTKELGTGFLQQIALKIVGDPDAPLTDTDSLLSTEGKRYKTVGDAFQEYLDSQFRGIDGDSMMILWSKTKDQFPELQAFPSNFNYDKLNNVVDTVRSLVATAWNTPLILANIATSGSLSKDDIKSASQMMYGVVRPYQMILERVYQKIINELSVARPELSGKVANIENYNPFPDTKTVDDKIWAEMTTEERRAWIKKNSDVELSEVQTTQKDSSAANESENPEQRAAQAQLRGSVVGVQGILSIADSFKKGIVSYESAKTILIEIFGFDDAVANNILK